MEGKTRLIYFDMSKVRCFDVSKFRYLHKNDGDTRGWRPNVFDISIYRNFAISIYRNLEVSICRNFDISIYRSFDISIYRNFCYDVHNTGFFSQLQTLLPGVCYLDDIIRYMGLVCDFFFAEVLRGAVCLRTVFCLAFRLFWIVFLQVVLQKRQQEAAKRHREYEQKMSREIQVCTIYMVLEGLFGWGCRP